MIKKTLPTRPAEPNMSRRSIRLLGLRAPLIMMLALTLNGCVLMQPKGYSEATAQLQQGDYASSVTAFERVAAENPEDEAVQTSLAEARFRVAEVSFGKAEASSENDPRSRIGHYRKTASVVGQSLDALNKLLAKPYDGPSMADQAQKMVNAEFRSLRERQTSLQRQASSLDARASEGLQKATAVLDKVLADAQRILEQNRSTPGSAYDDFIPLFPYAPHLTEVRDAKGEVEKITIDHFDRLGLGQVDKRDYRGAEQSFARIGKIEGGGERATAGTQAIVAHQAFLAKNYDAAYDAMLAIRAAYPESPFLKTYFDKTQGFVVALNIKAIDRQIAQGKLPGMIDAFVKLNRLLGVAAGNAPLLASLEPKRRELRRKIAADYIRQALALKKQDEALYSSLILRQLRLARQLDPEQTDAHEAIAAKALGVNARKAEIRVLVAFNGNGGPKDELARRLNSDLMAAIEKEGVPGLTFADPQKLTGSPTALATADLLIHGSIDAVEFVETGRDSPRRKSSKYISGSKLVDNPQYPIAKAAYEEAEAAYKVAVVAAQAAKNECRRLGTLLRIACEAAINYVASTGRDSALATYRATPQQISEDIVSSYQYDEYTVRLNGSVRGQCKVIDNLTRTETACTPINEKVRREGIIVRNAQSRDTENVRNGETDIADAGREQEALFGSISAALTAEHAKRVGAYRSERFCKLGELLEKQGAKLNAIEAYSLCALVNGKDASERTPQIEAKLNAHFGLSPAQISAFAALPAEEAEKWPQAQEVEAQSIKVAMSKLGRR